MKAYLEKAPSARGRDFAAVIVLIALTGCTPVNRLREAQDAFNQGAAAENAQRLMGGDAKATLASLTSVRTSYASALQSLNQVSDAEEKSLRADGLWGTALTLRALCQWRLGEYDGALTSVEQAKQSTPEQIYPRDQALLLALPGLIKTDQAYAITERDRNSAAPPPPRSFADVKELLVGSQGAVANIQSAREAVGKEHPVQAYLIQSQLAAYRNYMVAFDVFNSHAPLPPDDGNTANATNQLADLNAVLKLQPTDDAERKRLVLYWANLCALAPPNPL